MAQDKKVVRALDLGSGWSKFNRMVGDKLTYMSMPSLAPQHTGRDLSMSLLGKRDTVVVNVEGTPYEVGPDSADLDSNDATRNLNDQYIYSDQYKAVFYGSLYYMGETEIDLLVVGLPLTTLHRAPDLKKFVEGKHVINSDLTVNVKEALVLPQPMGGLYYALSLQDVYPEFEFLREETNLVVDPGYLTFDFLLANGDKINDARSSAHPGGVSKVLRSIAESLSQRFGLKYENLSAIDRAIPRRRIKINGQVEDLTDHFKYARPAIEGSINYLRNVAGDGSDIENIILLGGGHSLFARTILTAYKSHKIYVLADAQLANVKGFQAAGEQYLRVPATPVEQGEVPPLTVLAYEPPAPVAAPVAVETANEDV